MKPFRGKPEKPERSTGEIQSPRRRGPAVGTGTRGGSPPRALPSVRAGAGGVHFSPCRTSRPVGCRPKVRGGDRGVELARRPRTRGVPAGRPTVRTAGGGSLTLTASVPARRQVGARSAETGPVPGTVRAPLLASAPSDRPRTPVGDASALGNFRTRLETRTKESSARASHWERLNLKAQ